MPIQIAVLDDYQGVAFDMADWSAVLALARVDVYRDHLDGIDDLVTRLLPYDVICVMRERTPLTREIIARLPRLKLICSTGRRNASIDAAAAADYAVAIAHTSYTSAPTIEYTWALILASARHLGAQAASLRAGGWQTVVGDDMAGRTLGIIGLGSVGSQVARIGLAFGMKVLAWSQNLTAPAAAAVGVTLATKEQLLREADVISIHVVLSQRTTGLLGAAEFAQMKPTARLINTSRGPVVVEAALVDALTTGRIAGAAVDVYDQEPLPPDHPYRRLENLLATPHLGFVSHEQYRRFYGDTVQNILSWLDNRGIARDGAH